jgi:hypothetical protein
MIHHGINDEIVVNIETRRNFQSEAAARDNEECWQLDRGVVVELSESVKDTGLPNETY